jgi:DNA polymerase/3'-5' exonuclease PolX
MRIRPLTEQETKQFLKLIPRYLIKTGSIIRSDVSNDIDMLTTKDLKQVENYFRKKFQILYELKGGKKLLFFKVKYYGKQVKINIWYSTKENIPIMKLLHDYPKGFIIGIRKKLKSKGYRLSTDGIYKNKEKLKRISIKKIFKLADIKYRTPSEEHNKHLKK